MFVCSCQVYTRYRFLQRETRWKGLEDSLDECIDESMRTLDQVRNQPRKASERMHWNERWF